MKYKISFCTVCMNRLHHLKKTLPKNIKDNISYGSVEFVVLNYNSNDGLDTWIKTEMAEYLKNGILKYYMTTEPKSFHMSHSKNVVAKQACGDIVCNMDADNYAGVGFAEYINQSFSKNSNIYMAVDRKTVQRDCYGRICLLKKDFLTLKGYDESMRGYGFEDYDFWNRLKVLGRKVHYIKNLGFLKALTHDDGERLKNESNTLGIQKIFVRYIDHAASELLYLFHNNKFFKGMIIENRSYNSESIDNLFKENRTFEYLHQLHNDIWFSGEWSDTINGIELGKNEKELLQLKWKNEKTLEIRNGPKTGAFHEIVTNEEIEEMVMFFSQINNRIKMNQNKKTRVLAPNANRFGETALEYK